MKHFTWFLVTLGWITGCVLAKGFWLTALAVVFPFYAWYLCVELLLSKIGLI